MIQNLIISFVISIILGKYTIEFLKKRKLRQIVRLEGPDSHLAKSGTPTMGGIFVILTVLLMGIITLLSGSIEAKGYFAHILFASIGCGLVGFVDDFLKIEKRNTDGLSPKKKLGSVAVIGLIFSLLMVFIFKKDFILNIPFGGEVKLYKLLYIPFSIIVLLATTNTLNLTDGIDGLASSVGIIIMMFLLTVSLKMQNSEVAMLLLSTIGGFLGFLIYNWNKAKVFMGDVGSFFLGGVIGVSAIALNVPLYLFLIGIIPVVEAISVILQVAYYKKTKKRIFLMAPIHHHFEKKGWSELKVVFIFSAITLIGCILGYIAYIVR